MPVLVALPAFVCAADGAGPLHAQPVERIEVRDVAPGELRTEVVRVDRPLTVRIDAIGAEAGGLNRFLRARNAVAGVLSRLVRRAPPQFEDGWSATAWIVDAGSREVVWRLDAVAATPFDNGLRSWQGEIELAPGTYEVHYANFADVGWRGQDEPGWEYDRGAASRLRLRIDADEGRFVKVDAEETRRAFEAGNVVALGRDGTEPHDRIAFDVARPVEVEVYMVGEATRSRNYDYGWILDADTRETVWSFEWVRSQPAGGAARNRALRERITLPAGRYAAVFTRDRSHGPGSWRGLPPGDPLAWGLSIRPVRTEDHAAFRSYAYVPVNVDHAIVSLIRIGNGAAGAEGFTLTRDLAVRVFAIGEGRESRMFDYAWIEDAHTRQRVWTMRYEDTRHAGGTTRNRMFDGIVPLPAGSYIVHYVSDDSHAWEQWNSARPVDAEFWGVTVLPASGAPDPAIVHAYDEDADPRIIARIVRVGDGRQVRRRFTLDQETDVRVYALGEGTSSEMYDFARIVDASGREVWRMRYDDTEHAGGARKNRRANRVLRMAPGEYELIYRTDDSHAFGRWNGDPPDDPRSWGAVVVLEEGRRGTGD